MSETASCAQEGDDSTQEPSVQRAWGCEKTEAQKSQVRSEVPPSLAAEAFVALCLSLQCCRAQIYLNKGYWVTAVSLRNSTNAC